MAAASKGDLVFTKTTSDLGGNITVPIAFDSVTVQTLVNAIREYEDDLDNLDTACGVVGNTGILEAEGKRAIPNTSESIGITAVLINDWRVAFEARPGAAWVGVFVNDGNLLAENSFADNPIKPTAFTAPVIRQSQAPSIINAAVADFWDALLTELTQGKPAAEVTFGEAFAAVWMGLRNKAEVDTSDGYKKWYNDAGDVVFKKAVSDDGTKYTEDEMESGP